MPVDNRYNLFPTNAVRVKPGIKIKPDYYAEGGLFNPLAPGGGPESDFVPKPRSNWPAPTIPEGGTPVTFLREGDYPFDPNAGIPVNDVVVPETPAGLAKKVDSFMRPTMLIEAEKLALPFKGGEGRRYASSPTEALDPSVISEAKMHVKRTKADFFDIGGARAQRVQGQAMGMGDTSLLASLAMGPIEATMTSVLDQENVLLALNPGVASAVLQPYQDLRSVIQNNYNEMKLDPNQVTTAGVPFAAAAATYKAVLAAAIKKLKAEQKKSGLPALPGAIVKTVKSPYGMAVLGIGAAVVVGLLVWRGMQKKGD